MSITASQEMGTPLLTTKLNLPPRRPNLVRRPQLVERLNQDLHLGRKLILISAPAGFGKTTLVGEWVAGLSKEAAAPGADGTSVAWLSLDEHDNDPARFLAYLATAVAQIDGVDATIGRGALGMLQSPQPPSSEPVLTDLINDLATVPHRVILVLDDYHLIDSSTIDAALAFLVEHLPAQLHLVIATRIDPDLPLARLRARGQLTELRAAELRFTSAEAAKFLNEVMGLRLTPQDIAALETRTEGWIAGLQLAALALQGTISRQGRENARTLISAFSGSHRYVLDYLVDEVLDQQSAGVQEFLLQTAILNRLTGSLCDALTGQENGKATLAMLEQQNLFIIPLDEQRRWYRYHHLFADLLRQRLRQTEPEKLPALHVRAGDWFHRHGLNREATRHFLAGRDYQRAGALTRVIGIDILQQGEHTTLAEWIEALPGELVRQEPYLSVLHAWALMLTGRSVAAEARLGDAEVALERPESHDDEDRETIFALIDSHRAYLAFMAGELETTVAHARRALAHLPESAALIRAQTGLYLGVAQRYRGQLQAASAIYDELLPITERMGGNSIAVLSHLHLGDLLTEFAQLHRAREVYERALTLTERHTGRRDLPMCGYVYVSIGRILRQWNQLEDAYRYTTKGVALCREWHVADIMALSCIELAHLEQALGNDGQAQEAMDDAADIYAGFSPWGVRYAGGHQARIDLRRGDVDAAGRWAAANELDTGGEFQFYREIEYLALARLLLAENRFEEAHALATQISHAARGSGKKATELEGLILHALLYAVQDEIEQALGHLEKALLLAEPGDFVRIFVDEGPAMAALLYEALKRGLAPDYVRRLLAAFPAQERKRIEPSPAPASELLEPLSDRELEVLRLIALGLTNRQIGERLYLSLNTVKAHTRNIYGKLGVHSRTQAVARATALGLLDAQ